MNDQLLSVLVKIRDLLNHCKYDRGELSGDIVIDPGVKSLLVQLIDAEVLEDIIIVNDSATSLRKLTLGSGETVKSSITLFTKQIPQAPYYEDAAEFIRQNLYSFPANTFYIAEFLYFSGQEIQPPFISKYKAVQELVGILIDLADYVQDKVGEGRSLIFFEKKKLTAPLFYTVAQVRDISFLDKLKEQLNEAHDKEERKTIFKTELINYLLDTPRAEVFGQLLLKLDAIYDNYLKSHLLYIEKFSYHDLKAEVDQDQLDYTKKIYGTVNDIQSKMIAVPAAFLLIFSQFDYTGLQLFKNILILTGGVLFSILIDILLRNQFGLLRYIETDIDHLKTELKNKDIQLDLSEFVTSFGNLEPIIARQRNYLLFFRVITWVVPVITLVMLLVFKK